MILILFYIVIINHKKKKYPKKNLKIISSAQESYFKAFSIGNKSILIRTIIEI